MATKPALPAQLSDIGNSDELTATPSACTNGWRTNPLPRGGVMMNGPLATPTGWLFGYLVEGQGARVALRTISSDHPDAVQTIDWVTTFQFVLGNDGVPQLFYAPDTTATPPFTVLRARLVGGTWQKDATPVWSGTADGKNTIVLAPAIGPDGNARVFISTGPARNFVTENGSGGWTVSTSYDDAQLAGVGPDVYQLAVDKNGADHVIASTTTEDYVYVNDVGGAWKVVEARSHNASSFALDGSGYAHFVQHGAMGFVDHHATASGFVDDVLAIPSTLPATASAGPTFIDGAGALHFLAVVPDTGGAPDYVTNAGGAFTVTPVVSSSQAFFSLALDATNQPKVAVFLNLPNASQPATITACN